MSDKLSQEELIAFMGGEIDGLEIAIKMVDPDGTDDIEQRKILEYQLQACKQIKAMLTPVPKEKTFVEHIENHLRDMGIEGKVICKICGKDIDMIAKEAGVEVKNER